MPSMGLCTKNNERHRIGSEVRLRQKRLLRQGQAPDVEVLEKGREIPDAIGMLWDEPTDSTLTRWTLDQNKLNLSDRSR